MQYDLEPHKDDKDMIIATYTWTPKAASTKITRLAFMIHIDDIEDDEILAELREHGESRIDIKSIYGN